jgi:hypothetical protein
VAVVDGEAVAAGRLHRLRHLRQHRRVHPPAADARAVRAKLLT